MTRLSILIAAAAFAGFGLSAQASVLPSAAPAADPVAETQAMGPGPWCGAPQDKKGDSDSSKQDGSCEKMAKK